MDLITKILEIASGNKYFRLVAIDLNHLNFKWSHISNRKASVKIQLLSFNFQERKFFTINETLKNLINSGIFENIEQQNVIIQIYVDTNWGECTNLFPYVAIALVFVIDYIVTCIIHIYCTGDIPGGQKSQSGNQVA